MKAELRQFPKSSLPEVVGRRLVGRVVEDAREFKIPDEVIYGAVGNIEPQEHEDDDAWAARWTQLKERPLLYRMSCEYAYYYRRATNPVESRPPEPNDAVDLSLASYLTPGTVLVVEDGRLRSGALAQVMRPGAYCTLDELRGRLGLTLC